MSASMSTAQQKTTSGTYLISSDSIIFIIGVCLICEGSKDFLNNKSVVFVLGKKI